MREGGERDWVRERRGGERLGEREEGGGRDWVRERRGG